MRRIDSRTENLSLRAAASGQGSTLSLPPPPPVPNALATISEVNKAKSKGAEKKSAILAPTLDAESAIDAPSDEAFTPDKVLLDEVAHASGVEAERLMRRGGRHRDSDEAGGGAEMSRIRPPTARDPAKGNGKIVAAVASVERGVAERVPILPSGEERKTPAAGCCTVA